MVTVNFINIGHANANFERQVEGEVTEKFILDQVKPHCGSRNLEALVHKDGVQGIVLGGIRKIGEFQIIKAAP